MGIETVELVYWIVCGSLPEEMFLNVFFVIESLKAWAILF